MGDASGILVDSHGRRHRAKIITYIGQLPSVAASEIRLTCVDNYMLKSLSIFLEWGNRTSMKPRWRLFVEPRLLFDPATLGLPCAAICPVNLTCLLTPHTGTTKRTACSITSLAAALLVYT
ncbi:hypothetical protein PILCRDRAFT_648550 [Piloderma croceum F 1598]|uniref:Uncharacterized protein n=1 Tax=Piloderma croceum (strain F 1598) TaxID=765440 RepID=A0A0C3F9I0_PILCF|nr:hypothetical protein PILCRDRAFT_648550 [Piloderma croceum F 1598]